MSTVLAELKKTLPADSILTSKEDCQQFGMDWTKVPGSVLCVVLPRTVEEVSQILRICSQHATPIIPSGGRTGLAGGVVGSGKEVALSLTRLSRIDPVDETGFTVRVQSGVTTQAVHEHCEKEGLTWPIDLAAKGTSTIGGNLSTNAGGLRVIRYGMARKWVTAIQAVTVEGKVLELNRGLEKNNTGYDLLQLLIGAEGTLAVITEATLKLTRLPQKSQVLFFSLDSVEKLDKLFRKARKGPFSILACEFFSQSCLEAVQSVLNRRSKLSTPGKFYLLTEIEVENHAGAVDAVDKWLEDLLSESLVLDGMIAHSTSEQDQVWALREGITESLQQKAPVKKYDIAVPVAQMATFLNDILKMFETNNYELDLYLFGHYGDGSPHLNLLKRPSTSQEKFLDEYKRLNSDLFPLLKKHAGSVSAEHGIGILKKDWVTYSRSPEEVRLFKMIKQAFDPKNLLNPGKVIDLA